MLTVFLILNTIAAFASLLSGVLVLYKPQLFLKANEVCGSERYYSHMYAIRSVPIGILIIVLPWITTGTIISILLFCASLIQVLDAIFGIVRRNVMMIIGPSITAIIHLICGVLIF